MCVWDSRAGVCGAQGSTGEGEGKKMDEEEEDEQGEVEAFVEKQRELLRKQFRKQLPHLDDDDHAEEVERRWQALTDARKKQRVSEKVEGSSSGHTTGSASQSPPRATKVRLLRPPLVIALISPPFHSGQPLAPHIICRALAVRLSERVSGTLVLACAVRRGRWQEMQSVSVSAAA